MYVICWYFYASYIEVLSYFVALVLRANSFEIKKITVALVNEVRHDRDRDSAITAIDQC